MTASFQPHLDILGEAQNTTYYVVQASRDKRDWAAARVRCCRVLETVALPAVSCTRG